jgi:hypothetical protein
MVQATGIDDCMGRVAVPLLAKLVTSNSASTISSTDFIVTPSVKSAVSPSPSEPQATRVNANKIKRAMEYILVIVQISPHLIDDTALDIQAVNSNSLIVKYSLPDALSRFIKTRFLNPSTHPATYHYTAMTMELCHEEYA